MWDIVKMTIECDDDIFDKAHENMFNYFESIYLFICEYLFQK